jgi:hypothetical protein
MWYADYSLKIPREMPPHGISLNNPKPLFLGKILKLVSWRNSGMIISRSLGYGIIQPENESQGKSVRLQPKISYFKE